MGEIQPSGDCRFWSRVPHPTAMSSICFFIGPQKKKGVAAATRSAERGWIQHPKGKTWTASRRRGMGLEMGTSPEDKPQRPEG